MAVRRILAAAVAVTVIVGVSGCASAGKFDRPDAQADVAKWTSEAVSSVGSASAPRTTVSGYEACRTDNGFFITTQQWRTGTDVAVAASRQAAATAAIVRTFESDGWKASVKRGFTTLTGPGGASRRGVVQVQSAGAAQLAIQVISPCW